MIVRYVQQNYTYSVIEKNNESQLEKGADSHFDLGEESLVYAIGNAACGMMYYVMEKYGYYPVWYPAALFEVVDSRLPNDWKMKYPFDKDEEYLISFPEWVDDPLYYENLIENDSESREFKTFLKWKAAIEHFHSISSTGGGIKEDR